MAALRSGAPEPLPAVPACGRSGLPPKAVGAPRKSDVSDLRILKPNSGRPEFGARANRSRIAQPWMNRDPGRLSGRHGPRQELHRGLRAARAVRHVQRRERHLHHAKRTEYRRCVDVTHVRDSKRLALVRAEPAA
jgi:hypothetical protein